MSDTEFWEAFERGPWDAQGALLDAEDDPAVPRWKVEMWRATCLKRWVEPDPTMPLDQRRVVDGLYFIASLLSASSETGH